MASNNSTAKTHVSLRLPTYLLESIDAHAEKESISRTEAFVYYLQAGLQISDEKANEPSADEAMLLSIQSELSDIKAMLLAGGASLPVAASGEDDMTVPVSLTSEDLDDAEGELESEFTTSDAVYEGSTATEDTLVAEHQEDTTDNFEDGAENQAAAMFDTSDAVASPDEMPVEEIAAPAAPVNNVFSPNYQPTPAIEAVNNEADAETEEDEPLETLSSYYEGVAAEEEAESDFSDSDAVEEGSFFDEDLEKTAEETVVEDNPYVSSSYFNSTAAEDEAEAEEEAEEFSGSDAVFEETPEDEIVDDDEFEEDDEFDASDEVIDAEEIDNENEAIEIEGAHDNEEQEVDSFNLFSTSDAVAVEDEEKEVVEDDDDFDDSDAEFEDKDTFSSSYSDEDESTAAYREAADVDLFVGSAIVPDEPIDGFEDDELAEDLIEDIEEIEETSPEPLELSDLEDAVNLVAQQFPMIEKVWLFGNAATGGMIEQDTIDLCVKADKFKSKYADLFISMVKDNTGKNVNVVLRSEMEKSVKQVWKATRIDLYRA